MSDENKIEGLLRAADDLRDKTFQFTALAEMIQSLISFQDDDGKIEFDYITTYLAKIAFGLKKQNQSIDKNVKKELKKAGLKN